MEEEKKENGKRCYNCFCYRCHYTQGYMKFNREKTGHCTDHDKVVGHKDTCEHWRSKQHLKHRLSKITVKALNDTIAELVELTSIIKDDIENKNLSALARERLSKKLDAIEAEIEKEDD